ncbi:MAG TPA: kelch repeat-containing protein [Anaerolineales bacterium]|nr:kelch repeat-containing protein [Anaerolineales bacterium]
MSQTSQELSEREQEILRLVATGASNKEVARQLFISTNTVKVHLRNIYAKINVVSRTEAAMYAVNSGLLSDDVPDETESNSDIVGGVIEEIAIPENKTGMKVTYWWLIGLVAVIAVAIAGLLLRPAPVFAPAVNQNPPPTETPRWQSLTSLSPGRYGFASVVYESQIYVMGGETEQGLTASLQRYDPEKNSWMQLSDKPTPVKEIAAAVLGGRIFVPGGRLASDSVTNILEIYDPRTESWEHGAPMPVALSGYALSAFEGKIYVFGGWSDDGVSQGVYEYSPEQDQWNELPSMPTPRTFAGAAVSGRKIYVFGGFDGEKALQSNEVFQPDLIQVEQSPWVDAPDMPEGVYAMGAASLADIIYLVGGESDAARQFPFLAFFPQIGEWQAFEISETPIGSQLALVNLGSNLIALGGQIDGNPSTNALLYRAIYTVSIPVIIK